MKATFTCLIIFVSFISSIQAQQFISKAVIEYEVTANLKKTMTSLFMDDDFKDKLPTFKTGYYTFTFADNKSIYKFDHWSDASRKVPEWFRTSDESNIWYADYNKGTLNMQKNMWGSLLNVQDSLRKLEWRITTESRVIAGFNCSKAVTKIFDSVYVFAFYTDEILIPGGPCSISGLPGMILGVTIPRLYTSWIATKVSVTGVNENDIKPVSAKKSFTITNLKATVIDHTKDWFSDDPEINKEIQQQKTRTLWGVLL